MPDKITLSVRLTRDEYNALKAKCEACEPPTNPTAVLRWLALKWVKEK